MKIIADTHTHTLASTHAYSTILENIAYAKKIGLRAICNTDHGPAIAGSPQVWYFFNQKTLPEVIDGVILVKGIEANIVDYKGNLDVSNEQLDKLDWVIASFHQQVVVPSTFEDHTNAYLAVAENPSVDVIGHCGEQTFFHDYERCIKAYKEHGKIVEINSHSFVVRGGSDKNCPTIAQLCKKYEVPVVVSSDAHFCTQIGGVSASVALLEEIGFPEELILNADYDRFLEVIKKKSGRSFEGNVVPY